MSLLKRDQVVSVTLLLPRIDEPLLKGVPKGFSVNSKGGVTIDGNIIISELFGIPRGQLENWTKGTQHGLQLGFHGVRNPSTGEWVFPEVNSAGEAAGGVAGSLLNSGFSMERLRGLKYYVMARQDLKVYLVIVGNLSNPPPRALVGSVGN